MHAPSTILILPFQLGVAVATSICDGVDVELKDMHTQFEPAVEHRS